MQLEVHKRPTLSALTWVKRGWRIFTLNPSVFMGMAGVLMVVSLLSGLIPYFNFVALLIIPFLTAGFYQVSSQIEQDQKASVSDIFEYFSKLKEYRIFFRVAAVSVLLSIPVTAVATGMMGQLAEQQVPEFSQVLILSVLLLINFMATAFLIQSAWVAPESSIVDLVKLSFQACWLNGMPLTIYGLISLFIMLIAMPILLVGWVIAYAALMLMFLQAFLDIYRPVQEGGFEQSEENETASVQSQTENKIDEE